MRRSFVSNDTLLKELAAAWGDDFPSDLATFDALAEAFRAKIADRHHTPSEILVREGREERCNLWDAS